MPAPFSSQDLGRVLDARSLTRCRGLVLAGAVGVQLDGEAITVSVQDAAGHHAVRLKPAPGTERVLATASAATLPAGTATIPRHGGGVERHCRA
jgi:hypothetical protein